MSFYNLSCYFYQNARPAEVESVLLVLGQVHVTAYFNQDEDIGEEDQVLNPFVTKFWYERGYVHEHLGINLR